MGADDDLIPVSQACSIMNVSYRTIYRYAHAGWLGGTQKQGGVMRVSERPRT